MDSIIEVLGAATGFAALQTANEYGPLCCLCPPLGAVAVQPGAPASQPRAVIGAHAIAGLVGYGVVQSGLPHGEAVAVALTIATMSAAKMVHPPAGAYAFLYVSTERDGAQRNPCAGVAWRVCACGSSEGV